MTEPNISRQEKIEALSDAIRGSDAFKSLEKALKLSLDKVATEVIPDLFWINNIAFFLDY
jgi:hypothetical protein